MNEVQKTLIRQVGEQVFLKPGQVWIVDDATVRFRFGSRLNIDVRYDAGDDLYTVTTNKLTREYETKTTSCSHVYAEDLGRHFPERLVKDENVRALLAQVRGAA